jgi:tripartite-type tricarboxylate transporter receptor subunit TctC
LFGVPNKNDTQIRGGIYTMVNKILIGAIVAVAAIAPLAVQTPAVAAGYPEKDITLVIPYRAGGGFDVYGRAVARAMQKYLPNKVNVIPKNMPGAGGRKGTAVVYRAKPDGYTIGISNIPGASVPQILGQKVGYDVNKMVWIGRIAKDKYNLVVRKNSPYKSVADLKKAGGKIRFVNMSPGATQYLSYKVATDVLGIKNKDISGYRAMNPVLVGLIRGDGDAAVTSILTTQQYVANGDLRALAMFDTVSIYKGVPTAIDLGHPELALLGLERMLGAPPGLSKKRQAILESALLKSLQDPELKAWSKKANKPVHPLAGSKVKGAIAAQNKFYLGYKHLLGKKKKKKKK